MAPIRILLVDPEALVRRGLHMRLALEADLMVVGEATDAASAVPIGATLRPDVIVLDSGLDGICAAIDIVRRTCGARIVILSLQDDSHTRQRAAAAGAAAFVSKQERPEVLLETIKAVARSAGRGRIHPHSPIRGRLLSSP